MVNERIICCCGASSWTRIIAWIQIVGSALLLILAIVGLAGLSSVVSHTDINNEDTASDATATLAAMAITLIMAFLGLFMGIILLMGTNRRRVGYLRAWLIYGVVATVIAIIVVILHISGNSHSSTIGSAVVGGVLGIAINLFTLTVVYIHMKEINEGVFIP